MVYLRTGYGEESYPSEKVSCSSFSSSSASASSPSCRGLGSVRELQVLLQCVFKRWSWSAPWVSK